jgi:hypothetical protein
VPDPDLPPSAPDFAARGARALAGVVEGIRDKTLRPAATVARVLAAVLAAAILLTALAVLLAAGVLRLLDDVAFHRRVWASYLVLGGMFTGTGLFLLRARHSRAPRERQGAAARRT